MKVKYIFALITGLYCSNYSFGKPDTANTSAEWQTETTPDRLSIKTDTLNLFDRSRNRVVPIVLYSGSNSNHEKQKVVILNHGYGVKNTAYSYMAHHLATHGYVVASIQHDLPGDEPIPATGDVYETRKPFWERGVENILFVIRELKNRRPELDYKNLILIGHSNGGDMAMLFAHQHSKMAAKVISLDNRRMPFPRTSQPQLFSLRSSDLPADPGVLPTPEEQEKYNIRIVQLKNTIHNDMDDYGTEIQKQEINEYITQFLENSK